MKSNDKTNPRRGDGEVVRGIGTMKRTGSEALALTAALTASSIFRESKCLSRYSCTDISPSFFFCFGFLLLRRVVVFASTKPNENSRETESERKRELRWLIRWWYLMRSRHRCRAGWWSGRKGRERLNDDDALRFDKIYEQCDPTQMRPTACSETGPILIRSRHVNNTTSRLCWDILAISIIILKIFPINQIIKINVFI